MTVYIHPQIDIYYSGFYVYALEQKFGKRNIHYTAKPFGLLPPQSFEIFMFFIIDDGEQQRRYALDLYDMTTIKENVYEWCDVYGKINIHLSCELQLYPKMVVLAPSFGIKYWNTVETAYHVVDNLFKMHFYVEPNVLRTIKRGIKQWKRLPIDVYTNNITMSEDNYIFMISTLWHNSEIPGIGKDVNESRVRFIDACRAIPKVHFEGGLVVTMRSKYAKDKYDGYTVTGCKQTEWLEKTRKSTLVFNTPAYWNCHGWKLGEYLALGKCIISTPLYNNMPVPLEHGKNIHFVENTVESMEGAITYIIEHPDYRYHLENGAREYWNLYGTPEQSIKRLGIL